MILYHASPDQNLKYLDPKKQKSGVHGEKAKEVYATTDKSYAAGFSFNWNSGEGFRYGSDNRGPWILKVPPKYAQRLNQPCSIYVIEDSGFRNLNLSTPEYACKGKVKVIKEEKYQTALMCMRKNKVQVQILKRKPFMDNALTREFKDLIDQKNNLDSSLNDNFKIGQSSIEGKGVIATKEITPGDLVNIALFKGDKGFHTTRFGSYINHSGTPNAVTKDEGNQYITYCEKKINIGDEITVDYKVNPQLEQPEPSWE